MSAMRKSVVLALVVASLSVGREGPAEAYCRTTTVQSAPDYDVQTSGCFNQGVPLYQPQQCLSYRLFAKASPVIPDDILTDRLTKAFATWTAANATCTPGITPAPLAVSPDAEIASYKVGETADNVIGVPATWTHASGEMLALATPHYNVTTGEILDVDVEVNPTVKWSWTDPIPADAFDLQTVLTHAIGHMLGFAHSATPAAVMFGTLDPGAERRTLDPDDQALVCAVYPSSAQRLAGSGLVASTPCVTTTTEPDDDSGCSSTRSSPGSASGTLLGVSVATLFVALRRRRR